MESVFEGTRVEDTMTRIARKLGYPEVIMALFTNTVIQFTLHNESYLEFLELIHVIRISLKFLKPMKSHA